MQHFFKTYLLVVLALIASAVQVQVTSGAAQLSSEQIIQQLESDPQMAPDEVIKLIKQLGSYYKADGLDVASLVDQDDVSNRKCSHDKLISRHISKSSLAYELSDELNCVMNFMESRYNQQLQVCLQMFASQLTDEKFLSKLRSKTRKNIDLFHALAKGFETKKVATMMDGGDRALAVEGEFLEAKRARRKLAGKLVHSKAGADEKILKGLREACADVSFKLKPLMEFIKIAREHPDTWRQVEESKQLIRWVEIDTYCDRHNKLQLGHFDELDREDSLLK